jgi:low affinity Fe/Cu permease
MGRLFRGIAAAVALLAGTARAFVLATVLVLVLIGTGELFGYSDHWLALFSAVLSTITFLLVFLLQYRETRDTVAIQLKLNELLRAVEGAREHEFLDLEHLDEEEQAHRSHEFRRHVLDRRRLRRQP